MSNYITDIFKSTDDISVLVTMLNLYKQDIGEDNIIEEQVKKLKEAIQTKQIEFYIIKDEEEIVGMCSITVGFSTFNFMKMGIFEDFFIKKEYRKKGLASILTNYVFQEMKRREIKSVWVGCSDSDIEMYNHLGFDFKLGNLYTWNDF